MNTFYLEWITFFSIKWSLWNIMESLLASQHYNFMYQLRNDAVKKKKKRLFQRLDGSM